MEQRGRRRVSPGPFSQTVVSDVRRAPPMKQADLHGIVVGRPHGRAARTGAVMARPGRGRGNLLTAPGFAGSGKRRATEIATRLRCSR